MTISYNVIQQINWLWLNTTLHVESMGTLVDCELVLRNSTKPTYKPHSFLSCYRQITPTRYWVGTAAVVTAKLNSIPLLYIRISPEENTFKLGRMHWTIGLTITNLNRYIIFRQTRHYSSFLCAFDYTRLIHFRNVHFWYIDSVKNRIECFRYDS